MCQRMLKIGCYNQLELVGGYTNVGSRINTSINIRLTKVDGRIDLKIFQKGILQRWLGYGVTRKWW